MAHPKLLITGICGFVGASLAQTFHESGELTVVGIDNLSRQGSELNRDALTRLGIRVTHGDLRSVSDLESLPHADWVIDAAANPSVLAGVDGKSSSRQLVEHNLIGTLNLLEHCRHHKAGLILLSTSRVYSIPPLAALKMEVNDSAYLPVQDQAWPNGLSRQGVTEEFSTMPPVSLYGSTKLASETMALEYGETFGFPVWINRCGVLAGAGQFGRPDQGIFAYWLNAWLRNRPLSYIGFDGMGHQVRDAFHPRDLAALLLNQMQEPTESVKPRIVNVSGGIGNAMSLAQLSRWCTQRWGERTVAATPAPRPFDIPWMVLDHGLASKVWNWKASKNLEAILDEIADHAEQHPDWLATSGVL